MDYQKMYSYLVGQIDDTLGMMYGLDIMPTAGIRKKLENALLTAEEMYIDQEEQEEN